MSKENILIESDRISITKIDHTMYMDIYHNSQDEDLKRFVPEEVFSSLEEAKCAVLEKCGFELYFKGKGIYQGQERRIIKSIIRLK